jgi:hypothetical protein
LLFEALVCRCLRLDGSVCIPNKHCSPLLVYIPSYGKQCCLACLPVRHGREQWHTF